MTSQSPTFQRTVAVLMAAYQERMAANIRRERLKLGLTEAELAYRIGTSERQVRRWESAENEPQPPNLRALAELFSLEIVDIRPDLEAEEQALKAQLDRIEQLLQRLLDRLPAIDRADEVHEIYQLLFEAEHARQAETAAAEHRSGTGPSRAAEG